MNFTNWTFILLWQNVLQFSIYGGSRFMTISSYCDVTLIFMLSQYVLHAHYWAFFIQSIKLFYSYHCLSFSVLIHSIKLFYSDYHLSSLSVFLKQSIIMFYHCFSSIYYYIYKHKPSTLTSCFLINYSRFLLIRT